MNKKIIKNILLVVSFIPYIIALICGVLNCIAESKAHTNFNFYFVPDDLFIPLGNFYTEKIQTFDIPYIIIFLFAICYPIYFIVDLLVEKRKMKIITTSKCVDNESQNDNEYKIGKSFILFIISFLPYLLMTYVSVFGMQFFSMVYGSSAVFLIVIVCTIVPIYPITFVFQLIYLIKLRHNFSKTQKNITKYIIIGILISVIIPCIIHSVIH